MKTSHIRPLWICGFTCGIALLIFCNNDAQAGESKGEPAMKKLPAPKLSGPMSLEETILKRRSVREFTGEKLTDQEISQLLWAAQGITDTRNQLRAAPSAGATFPLETYCVTHEGIFRYLPLTHALETVKGGDHRRALSDAALGQPWVAQAPVTIVFTAVPGRTTGRYGQRGMMYIHMEAGHAAQNIHLQAVSLGLGSVPIGAFQDSEAAVVLELKKNETPLYMIPVGRVGE